MPKVPQFDGVRVAKKSRRDIIVLRGGNLRVAVQDLDLFPRLSLEYRVGNEPAARKYLIGAGENFPADLRKRKPKIEAKIPFAGFGHIPDVWFAKFRGKYRAPGNHDCLRPDDVRIELANCRHHRTGEGFHGLRQITISHDIWWNDRVVGTPPPIGLRDDAGGAQALEGLYLRPGSGQHNGANRAVIRDQVVDKF